MTLYFSAPRSTPRSFPALDRSDPRVLRILRGISERDLTTAEVYAVAAEPGSARPSVERGKTRAALIAMKRSGLIRWREHTLSILSCGWDVLAGASAGRAA